MSDIIGPADAPNSVTVRPEDERAFSNLDSWFKDCSSPTADDGTDIQASFLNGTLALLRSLWRGNGKKQDGVTNIVPENGNDDAGLLKAVQHLIQRGQTLYGEDTGTENSVVVSLSPALAEYRSRACNRQSGFQKI